MNTEDVIITLISWAITYAIFGTIFGLITRSIIKNKGYRQNWFLWGFFFGVIAIIVAAAKPDLRYRNDQVIDNTNVNYGGNVYNNAQMPAPTPLPKARPNTWICPNCRVMNSINLAVCACGTVRNAELPAQNAYAQPLPSQYSPQYSQPAPNNYAAPAYGGAENSQKSDADQRLEKLKKYMAMRDCGAISQEEYNEMEKQIMNV